MNTNTFASLSNAYPSGHPFALPAAFTTTSATETAFLVTNGTPALVSLPLGTEILGSQTPFSPGANSALAHESGRSAQWLGENRPFFNSGSFNARPFKIRATGIIAGGGTTLTSISATVSLYAALTQITTVTSGTKVATVTVTGGIGAAKAAWYIDTTFIWDSVSQKLQLIGNYSAQMGGTNTATTAAAITALALSSVNFGLTWTFATTSTSNSIGMTELSAEQV